MLEKKENFQEIQLLLTKAERKRYEVFADRKNKFAELKVL